MPLTNIKKILLIKLRSLGDLVLTTPCTRAIKEAFPESQLVVMVQEGLEEVMAENPFVDKIIIYRPDAVFFSQLSFLLDLKKTGYDFVINLHGGPRSAIYSFFSSARYRLGGRQKKDFFNWIYNIRVRPWNEILEDGEGHCVEQHLAILRCAGIGTKNKELVLKVSQKNEIYINKLLAEYGVNLTEKIIVIHPSATSAAKSWTKEKFAKLADILIKEYKTKVVFTGSLQEKKYISEINGLMQFPAIDLSGRTTVGQMAALYQRSGFFLGLDSGPAHVASAVGSKLIVLFGPSHIPAWHPWVSDDRYVLIKKDLPCIGCCQGVCPLHEKNLCMENIEVEEVLAEIKKLMF